MKYPAYAAYQAASSDGVRYPSGWRLQRLRFAVETNPVKSEVADWPDDTVVSFVPMEALGETGSLNLSQDRELAEVYNGYSYFADGDVVVAKITPCFENGKGALTQGLTNGVGFGTTELHVLRASPQVSPRWLLYLTQSHTFRKQGEAHMYGAGGQKRVPEDFIKNYWAGLPGLDEQESIAEFLDLKTGQIDSLIAKKQALIEALSERRASLVTAYITGAKTSLAERRTSRSGWLRDLPAHWQEAPMGFLAQFLGGMTPNMARPDYWDGNVPWVSPKDMKRSSIDDSADHVTDQALLETGLSLIPVGAVLVVVRGMILAHSFPVAITTAPVTINQDMKALLCGDDMDAQFLFWFLSGLGSMLSNLAEESAHGTRKMETETLKKLVLPVPPKEEQRKIALAIQEAVAELDQLAEAAALTVVRLTEYRSALITAATTGQIDVRGVTVPSTA